MAESLMVFETKKDKHIEDAIKTLTEAVGQGFEAVFIIGFKDDRVIFKHSAALDMMTKLGLIEAAKLDWFNDWTSEFGGVTK